MGHAAPFAFDPGFRPAPGIAGFRIGTPPVLAMRVLDTALDIFEGIDMAELATRSADLSERLIAGVGERCPALTLASPADPHMRGSHVSFACPRAYPVMQALIRECRVIGDVRAPDLLRFGIAPLYVDENDIDRCIESLITVHEQKLWDRPDYHVRNPVT